jgi:hypothetical protein
MFKNYLKTAWRQLKKQKNIFADQHQLSGPGDQ